ncbi:hypothetical protein NM688_g3904 [Phlebia brevispora]|uniref:Uncharacterized protein n=1 Tax=Phlebia brevispora TaxID=194682 RepID=A0ACC1T525_9APHY|nr:hypothetical protein NM688_g3904 [Phlebia brevispora]
MLRKSPTPKWENQEGQGAGAGSNEALQSWKFDSSRRNGELPWITASHAGPVSKICLRRSRIFGTRNHHDADELEAGALLRKPNGATMEMLMGTMLARIGNNHNSRWEVRALCRAQCRCFLSAIPNVDGAIAFSWRADAMEN